MGVVRYNTLNRPSSFLTLNALSRQPEGSHFRQRVICRFCRLHGRIPFANMLFGHLT